MEFGKIEKKNLRPSGSWNPDWKTEKSNLEKHKCIHQVIGNDDEYSRPYLIRQNRLCPDQRIKNGGGPSKNVMANRRGSLCSRI